MKGLNCRFPATTREGNVANDPLGIPRPLGKKPSGGGQPGVWHGASAGAFNYWRDGGSKRHCSPEIGRRRRCVFCVFSRDPWVERSAGQQNVLKTLFNALGTTEAPRLRGRHSATRSTDCRFVRSASRRAYNGATAASLQICSQGWLRCASRLPIWTSRPTRTAAFAPLGRFGATASQGVRVPPLLPDARSLRQRSVFAACPGPPANLKRYFPN